MKYSIRELAEIFPEAMEIIRDKIIEEFEKLDNAKERIYSSYINSNKNPEAAPICEVASEIIFESEILPAQRNLNRLIWQHLSLTQPELAQKSIDIQSLKSKISLKDLAENYGIKLRKLGNKYKALCPFHSEKTPSFYIYEKSNSYNCFGCGENGDIFDFFGKLGNLNFKETLITLQKYV